MIVVTKFQLKLTILSFGPNLPQNLFQSKTEQGAQGSQAFAFYVVNVNSTVVFKLFEDLKNLIILNIWLCLASCTLSILK